MIPTLPYPTAYDTAMAVKEVWKSLPSPDVWLLPYNRFAHEDSRVWWLVPARDRAAFRYAKLCFSTHPNHVGEGQILCGLHVEKGIEAPIPEANWILQEDWVWHRFLENMGEALAKAVRAAAEILHAPIGVLVIAHAYNDPGGGPADRAVYTSTGEELVEEETGKLGHVTAHLRVARSWAELAEKLTGLPRETAAWYWLGMHVGGTFGLQEGGDDRTEECVKMLRCFESWLYKP